MDLFQILVTAVVGLVASAITAVLTHFLTRAQERQKHEREVAAKLAELKSAERNETMVMAVQYGHSCFIIKGVEPSERDRIFLPMGSRITLGRLNENHIRLNHPCVSGIHAAFRAQGSSAYAEPLGATNGLAINGEIVTQPHKLIVGDVITVPGAPFQILFVPLVT